jgi:hypothetical protein
MKMTFREYEKLAEEIPNSHYSLSYYEKFLLGHILEMAKRGQELESENADLRNQLKAALERC